MKRLLACIDFSDAAPTVLARAESLARALSAELVLLHVAAPDPAFVGFDVGPQSVRDARARVLRAEHTELLDSTETLRGKGIESRAMLVAGPTVETIVAEAERLDVDAIIVGSHGRGPVGRVLLGSVSSGLLQQAPCPVMVIPPRVIASE